LESKVLNSESLVLETVGSTEKEEIIDGDHCLHTTSGTITTVPTSSAEILDLEEVLEPEPETTTTERTSTRKLDTEDAQVETLTSSNAEDTADQTTMIRVLMLMSDALENHGTQYTSRLVVNTESPKKVGLKEKEEMDNGDHSLLTTSGITTMVPELYAKILDTVKVLEPTPETRTTELHLTLQLETEDVHLDIPISFNAESMVDQTKETSVLKHMSNAQVNHGLDQLERPVENSLSLVHQAVGFIERQRMEYGDH
jgi:hypothetical protein